MAFCAVHGSCNSFFMCLCRVWFRGLGPQTRLGPAHQGKVGSVRSLQASAWEVMRLGIVSSRSLIWQRLLSGIRPVSWHQEDLPSVDDDGSDRPPCGTSSQNSVAKRSAGPPQLSRLRISLPSARLKRPPGPWPSSRIRVRFAGQEARQAHALHPPLDQLVERALGF